MKEEAAAVLSKLVCGMDKIDNDLQQLTKSPPSIRGKRLNALLGILQSKTCTDPTVKTVTYSNPRLSKAGLRSLRSNKCRLLRSGKRTYRDGRKQ